MTRSWSVGLVLGLGFAAAACGGAAGDKVRPPDYTSKDAFNGAPTCSGKPSLAKPYVVDLDTDARTSLEAAMNAKKKGVVVVAFDCKSLRVLRGCKAPGSSYEYAGVQRKEDVIQLKSRDELSANLPFSSGKLGAELTSGRSLDLATVAVGQKAAIISAPSRADLEGSCEEATHYVSTATIGAFSMATGSAGKVVAAAEVFKIGANGKSEATRSAAKSDGSFDACKTSAPDAEEPPKDCAGPLRVELLPFKDAPAPAADKPKKKDDAEEKEKKGALAEAVENPCPEGFVLSGDACMRPSEKPHVCKMKDEADCKEQCDKGSAESCYNLAMLQPDSMPPFDRAAIYKKSCELGFADGCGSAALYQWPISLPVKSMRALDKLFTAKYEKEWRESLELAKKGCQMGSAESCENLGETYDMSVEFPNFADPALAQKAYERGCRLGNAMACGSAAGNLRQGNGVKQDFQKALALLERSCDGGVVDNCIDLADVLHEGHDGSPKDPARAFAIASRYCSAKTSWDGCMVAAESAKAAGKDDKTVFEMWKAECDHGSWNGCDAIAEMYASGKGTPKDPAKAREIWKKACEEYEDADACKKIGKAPPAAAKPAAPPKKGSTTKPGAPAKKK